ncbi:hypothetical protein MPG70_00360 [Helicobacter pylori]|nr:hypothetical protein [Helicobacter pylori]UOS65112.1 hypothetical protein MPG70_00360 [Helicobacter pylori]
MRAVGNALEIKLCKIHYGHRVRALPQHQEAQSSLAFGALRAYTSEII